MTGTDRPLAAADRGAAGWVLRFERQLVHPREKVWRSLTESEHLRPWLPCDIVGDRRTGAPIELPFWPEHVEQDGIAEVLQGEIRVCDPPNRFEWTWDTDVLRWDLDESDGGGTQLTFTTWLGPDDEGAVSTATGYHLCLDSLAELLDTGATTAHTMDVDPTLLESTYRASMLDSAD